MGLVFVGLLARNGDELAEEVTSTTTRRNKMLEIKGAFVWDIPE